MIGFMVGFFHCRNYSSVSLTQLGQAAGRLIRGSDLTEWNIIIQ